MRGVSLYFFKSVSLITIIFLLAAVYPAAAATPNIGTALDGVKPPPSGPAPDKAPGIAVDDKSGAVTGDRQQTVKVSGFRIGGEPPMAAEELLALVRDEAGKELTLAALNNLAARLTRHLRQKGYPVAFAYIPAQEVRDGVVEIAVAPGKFGRVIVRGDSRVDPGRLTAMLFAARPGTVITQPVLERALLLMNDLSGIAVTATLAPSQNAGAADVILDVVAAKPVKGILFADNWGNRYTTRERTGAMVTVAGSRGDELELGGILTTSNRLNNYYAGYKTPLGHDGLTFGAKYTKVRYTLGEDFADLGAVGQAKVISFKLDYPLIRSQAFSLFGSLGYDSKKLRDDITYFDNYSPRRNSLWSLGLSGQFRDGWLGGGRNDFSLTRYSGRLVLEDAATALSDAASARTSGHFTKTLLAYNRLQFVTENLQLIVRFRGQISGKNLDSSEKFFLGGPTGVRAFSQGEAGGDQGYSLTGELAWQLRGLSAGKNQVFLCGFYDYGSVMLNKHPWAGAGSDNRRSLMGAGLGLMWIREKDFVVRLDYAWKIGRETDTESNRNGRLWLLGMKEI